MKNISINIYLPIILFFSVAFQINLSRPKEASFVCTYKLTYQLDSLNKEKRSELMLLTVSPSLSKFESQYSYFIDSISASPSFDQSSLDALTPYLKTGFNYKIYKTYSNKTINHYDIIGQTLYNIKQKPVTIAWRISSESRTIANFTCRKATASYGGRQWVAWFTTEIPVSDGPYKFMGLPGLITELADTRGHYAFTLIRLAKLTPGTKVSFPTQAITTTQAEYTKGKFTNDLQKVSEIIRKNHPETALQEIQKFKQKQARKNNPIELK